MLPKLQRHKDSVRCAALGAEVPGHRQEQLTQTLIVRLLKTYTFLHQSLIVKSQQNRIELVTRPVKQQQLEAAEPLVRSNSLPLAEEKPKRKFFTSSKKRKAQQEAEEAAPVVEEMAQQQLQPRRGRHQQQLQRQLHEQLEERAPPPPPKVPPLKLRIKTVLPPPPPEPAPETDTASSAERYSH